MRDVLHEWQLTFSQAKELQKKFAPLVISDRPLTALKTLAAADVSFDRGSPYIHAGVVVLDWPSLNVLERASASERASFPYVPGYLSFRELPPLLRAFDQVQTSFEAVLCDGQGIAHPRRLGLASHLGLWLNLPTIGCAKRPLWGAFTAPLDQRGAFSPIMDGPNEIGSVVRTKARVKPVFVSPGHLCDLASARRIVLESVTNARVPHPLRLAHEFVNSVRRDHLARKNEAAKELPRLMLVRVLRKSLRG